MKKIILVAVSQFSMLLLKHYNIRVINSGNRYLASLITLVIQSMWLVSSAIGISGYLDSNWAVVAAYLLSGALGSFFSFKIKIRSKNGK